MHSVGIIALAVHLPEGLRTNSWWDNKPIPYYGMTPPPTLTNKKHYAYDKAMEPYITDPFLGSIERRVVYNNETSVSLGVKAAAKALQAANLSANEIDGLIAVSMYPDRLGFGDAALIAEKLGIGGGAFNIEASCNGAMSALLTACGLVKSGIKSKVLVVTTTLFSRIIDDDKALRFVSDLSTAFIIGTVENGFGLLGSDSLHLGQTSGNWSIDIIEDQSLPINQRMRLRPSRLYAQVIRTTAEQYLTHTVKGALCQAKLSIGEIDCVALSTTTAWHAEFSANVLGIDKTRVINTYPQIAYAGLSTVPFNLYTAASQQMIKPGEIILLYGYGGQTEASAAIFRWNDISLGPPPDDATIINQN
ncbi:3-oxoacyl-ACP synthase III family protein [Providencia stuartii]|uniref:3-oxoacyl-ACP synthase III family protein n=1 Tax=Providencia stuartii TaxID=588 RepID=UPI00300167E8